MTDQLGSLLASSPELSRASRMEAPRLPVTDAFEQVLPDGGLRLGTTTSVGGLGATSLALALIAQASRAAWIAAVGMPQLGLVAASELGVDLTHLVTVPDPGDRWTETLSAAVDAFDVILTRSVNPSTHRKLGTRIRERNAVLVSISNWRESDLLINGERSTWHGIDKGHGYLAARTLEVSVSGRRSAARPRQATLWLPDIEGEVRLAKTTVGAGRSGRVPSQPHLRMVP